MKWVIIVVRVLLGLAFFASGLMGLLMHPKLPPTLPPDAVAWDTIMMNHHWMTFVAVIMLIAGLLLLVNRFVPLALTLLGPILVNIILFHVLLAAPGVFAGIVLSVFEVFLIFVYRRNFLPLFAMNPETNTTMP